MGWKSELKSLPVQRNGFIEITLFTSMLKLDPQGICKVAEQAGLIDMGRKLELKSCLEQRNAFIKITLLTSLLKLGQQCTSKVV